MTAPAPAAKPFVILLTNRRTLDAPVRVVSRRGKRADPPLPYSTEDVKSARFFKTRKEAARYWRRVDKEWRLKTRYLATIDTL